MRNGEDIYFLSNYSLYLPGKVIIHMFIVTNTRYLYSDLSLYRISSGGRDELERLWSFGPDISGKKVDLDYQHADKVSQSKVWGRAGLLPLSEWNMPSPLQYSSRDPKFLKRVIVEQKADLEFRSAAYAELDAQRDSKILREILAEFEKVNEDIQRKTYSTKWDVLIRMSATLRGDSPPDVFSAAFDNDAETLQEFLDAGADPNSSDDAGRSLLMYAVLGEAPDTMTLLFNAGADPEKETDSGDFPWLYAALNPLRQRFLELWGK